MSVKRKPRPRFRVGDWVSFLYGRRRALAQVIEDRGPLGVNRRRLYRLQLHNAPGDEGRFELPEQALEAAVAPPDYSSTPKQGDA